MSQPHAMRASKAVRLGLSAELINPGTSSERTRASARRISRGVPSRDRNQEGALTVACSGVFATSASLDTPTDSLAKEATDPAKSRKVREYITVAPFAGDTGEGQ